MTKSSNEVSEIINKINILSDEILCETDNLQEHISAAYDELDLTFLKLIEKTVKEFSDNTKAVKEFILKIEKKL